MSKPASEYLGVPYVQEQMAAAAKYVAVEAEAEFIEESRQRMECNAGEGLTSLAFDSPLEAVFWLWWMAFHHTDSYTDGLQLVRHVGVEAGGQRFVLDFVVRPTYRRFGKPFEKLLPHWPLVGIELDGHAFHEKTLAQVQRRNQRDRTLQQAGWHIFHFAFSEFTNDQTGCLIELIDFVREQELRIRQLIEKDKADPA